MTLFKKHLITFSFLCLLKGNCQVNENIFLKIIEEDNIVSTSSNLNNIKIHLIGEWHHQEPNFLINLAYLKWLNSNNIYPNYILREEGESVSFLRNIYFETGDEFILNIIEGSDISVKQFKLMREYFLKLPIDKRFLFKGVDSEYSYFTVHYTTRFLFLKHKNDLQEYNSLVNNTEYRELFRSIEDKKNPQIWAKSNIIEDLDLLSSVIDNKDSLLLKSFFKSDYIELKSIFYAYNLERKRKHSFYRFESENYKIERELFMTNNIYHIFLSDTNGVSLGQFGLYHVKLIDLEKNKKQITYRLANILNNNKIYKVTNKKIASNMIYYSNGKRKFYSDININLKKVKKTLDVMQKMDLYLLKCENNALINNLIIFKN